MEGKLDFDVKRLIEGVPSKTEDQWKKLVKFNEEMKEFQDNFDIRFDELHTQLASMSVMFKESHEANSEAETSVVQQSDRKTAEFELSHQLNNSNRYESLQIPKIDFPIFDGVGPREWIRKCEQYFTTLVVCDDDLKIRLAELHLRGEADLWLIRWKLSNHFISMSWEFLKDEVCRRFEEEPMEAIVDELHPLNQSKSNPDCATLEIKNLPDSEEIKDREFEIKHSFVEETPDQILVAAFKETYDDADTTGDGIVTKQVVWAQHELESFPIHESVDEDIVGEVCYYEETAKILAIYSSTTWVEEVSSDLKVIFGQNVLEKDALKVIDEMTQKICAVVIVEQVIDMYSNGTNFYKLTLFDPGGGGNYVTRFSKGIVSSLSYTPSIVAAKGRHCLVLPNHFHIFSSGIHAIFSLIVDSMVHRDEFSKRDLRALFGESNSELWMKILSFDLGGSYLSQMIHGPFELDDKLGDICLQMNVDDALVKAKEYCAKEFGEQLIKSGLSPRPDFKKGDPDHFVKMIYNRVGYGGVRLIEKNDDPFSTLLQNSYFPYSIAYEDWGIKKWYPLAKLYEKMHDKCIQMCHELDAPDDEMQACMDELGLCKHEVNENMLVRHKIPVIGRVDLRASNIAPFKFHVTSSTVRTVDNWILIEVDGVMANWIANWMYFYSTWLLPIDIADHGDGLVNVDGIWMFIFDPGGSSLFYDKCDLFENNGEQGDYGLTKSVGIDFKKIFETNEYLYEAHMFGYMKKLVLKSKACISIGMIYYILQIEDSQRRHRFLLDYQTIITEFTRLSMLSEFLDGAEVAVKVVCTCTNSSNGKRSISVIATICHKTIENCKSIADGLDPKDVVSDVKKKYHEGGEIRDLDNLRGYLLEGYIMASPFAPRVPHQAKIQLLLERGMKIVLFVTVNVKNSVWDPGQSVISFYVLEDKDAFEGEEVIENVYEVTKLCELLNMLVLHTLTLSYKLGHGALIIQCAIEKAHHSFIVVAENFVWDPGLYMLRCCCGELCVGSGSLYAAILSHP